MRFIRNAIGMHHVTEQALDTDLPEWRKMPYCKAGKFNFSFWDLVDVDPLAIPAAQVCGACRQRLAHNGIYVEWLDGSGGRYHTVNVVWFGSLRAIVEEAWGEGYTASVYMGDELLHSTIIHEDTLTAKDAALAFCYAQRAEAQQRAIGDDTGPA